MDQHGIIRSSFYILILIFLFSCVQEKKNTEKTLEKEAEIQKSEIPNFNADSAYFFVEKQVLFGPRSPNSEAHKKCGNYLESQLKKYGAKIYIQESI